MAFLYFLGQALPAHLVGGCGARAVSRKTPIYFILTKFQVPMCTMPTSATSPEDLSSSKSTTLTGVSFANIYAYDIHIACVTGQVKYKRG